MNLTEGRWKGAWDSCHSLRVTPPNLCELKCNGKLKEGSINALNISEVERLSKEELETVVKEHWAYYIDLTVKPQTDDYR
jgi:hypothetical protein